MTESQLEEKKEIARQCIITKVSDTCNKALNGAQRTKQEMYVNTIRILFLSAVSNFDDNTEYFTDTQINSTFAKLKTMCIGTGRMGKLFEGPGWFTVGVNKPGDGSRLKPY